MPVSVPRRSKLAEAVRSCGALVISVRVNDAFCTVSYLQPPTSLSSRRPPLLPNNPRCCIPPRVEPAREHAAVSSWRTCRISSEVSRIRDATARIQNGFAVNRPGQAEQRAAMCFVACARGSATSPRTRADLLLLSVQ